MGEELSVRGRQVTDAVTNAGQALGQSADGYRGADQAAANGIGSVTPSLGDSMFGGVVR